MIPNIYEQLELPDKIISTNKTQSEEIYSFLKDKNIKNTLEIGFAYGCSAAYIIAATQSKHIVIDPVETTDWKSIGLKNIDKLGYTELLRFEEDCSHNILPKLLKEGIKVDFAFIDNGHLFDYTLVDFFYIDHLLNIGGYVLFDDTQLASTQKIEKWIIGNKVNYKLIKKDNNLLLFQKTSNNDNREGAKNFDHFVDF